MNNTFKILIITFAISLICLNAYSQYYSIEDDNNTPLFNLKVRIQYMFERCPNSENIDGIFVYYWMYMDNDIKFEDFADESSFLEHLKYVKDWWFFSKTKDAFIYNSNKDLIASTEFGRYVYCEDYTGTETFGINTIYQAVLKEDSRFCCIIYDTGGDFFVIHHDGSISVIDNGGNSISFHEFVENNRSKILEELDKD